MSIDKGTYNKLVSLNSENLLAQGRVLELKVAGDVTRSLLTKNGQKHVPLLRASNVKREAVDVITPMFKTTLEGIEWILGNGYAVPSMRHYFDGRGNTRHRV